MIAYIVARWQIFSGLAALLVLTHTLAYCEGRSAAEAEQAALDLKAQQKAREADAAASATVKGTNDAVEQANDRAREAARTDDPLGDGLRSLRTKTRPDPAAR